MKRLEILFFIPHETYWLNAKDRGFLLHFFGFQFNICLQLRGKPNVLGFSFLISMLDNALIVFKREVTYHNLFHGKL